MIKFSLLFNLLILFFNTSLNIFAQSKLSYNSTENQSMSKYQRIGHIESYLQKLNKDIRQKNSQMNSKFEMGDKNILLKLKSVERELKILKSKIEPLEKSNEESGESLASDDSSIDRSTQDKLLDSIEENKAKIEALQESHLGLEATLKSIQEMLKVEKELQ